MSNKLFDVEIEKHFLGCLLQYPQTYGEVSLAATNDFSTVHQPIFQIIKQQLDSTPVQPVTPVILADKLKSYNVDLGVDAFTYLDALRLKPVKREDAEHLCAELKKLTVRRELIAKCDDAKQQLLKNDAKDFNQMVNIVDSTLSSVNTQYFQANDTINIFEGMEDKIEEEGNRPMKEGEIIGYTGPFQSITNTIGSLTYRGAFVIVGARTNQGKSSLSWFYNVLMAEAHNLPLLCLDAAEMTPEEIQYRLVCALSGGVIPYNELVNRRWRKNAEWVKLIRENIWPRVRKMEKTGVFYKNIGTMKPQEVIRYIRRTYYNKAGRGNFLPINFDYIKGGMTGSKNDSEHQVVGSFVNDLKSLITEDINASIWAGVQNNRSGISTGKNQDELNAENEGQMGLSDRIIQQGTHGFIMRYKTVEELAREGNRFGNVKMVCVKKRQLIGAQYEKLLFPVKTPHGFVNDYFNIQTKGFAYWDKGMFSDMQAALGNSAVYLDDKKSEDKTIP